MSLWIWWGIGLTITTIISSWVIVKRHQYGYPILIALFAGYVLSANILVPRIIELDIGFTMLILTTGSVIWPFTAQISDMINEIYGKKKAYFSVIIAYAINLIFITFIYMGASAQSIWSLEEENFWLNYFLPAPRILIASSVAFLITQFVDIIIFAKLKSYFSKWESSKNLKGIIAYCTIRSVSSDLVNMILDGIIFTILAFSFTVPFDILIALLIGGIIGKGFLAVIDTPWFIAFRIGVKNVEREFD